MFYFRYSNQPSECVGKSEALGSDILWFDQIKYMRWMWTLSSATEKNINDLEVGDIWRYDQNHICKG